jgi:hypothetical protein
VVVVVEEYPVEPTVQQVLEETILVVVGVAEVLDVGVFQEAPILMLQEEQEHRVLLPELLLTTQEGVGARCLLRG